MIELSALCFGFTTIDYVCLEDGQLNKTALGGTAANVCTALSRLGVRVGLVAVVGDDARGRFAIEALAREHLAIGLIESRFGYATPFCIEILKQRENNYCGHSFRSLLFRSEQRSSRFIAPTKALLNRVMTEHPKIKLLFTNKQFHGILDLIDCYSPVLVYEPDCVDLPDLHRELVSRCDVYKFSHEQFIDYAYDFADDAAKVVIETFGSEGLRFRLSRGGEWQHLIVSGGPELLDTSGAGDWFSAGLIAQMLKAESSTQSADQMERAISVAAKMSRLSCAYMGATGFAVDEGWEDYLEEMTVTAGRQEFADEERLVSAVADPHSVQ